MPLDFWTPVFQSLRILNRLTDGKTYRYGDRTGQGLFTSHHKTPPEENSGNSYHGSLPGNFCLGSVGRLGCDLVSVSGADSNRRLCKYDAQMRVTRNRPQG